jgi:hypothetical protein
MVKSDMGTTKIKLLSNKIVVANWQSQTSVKYGDFILFSDVNNQANKLLLQNVLVVPQLMRPLLLLRFVAKDEVQIIMQRVVMEFV